MSLNNVQFPSSLPTGCPPHAVPAAARAAALADPRAAGGGLLRPQLRQGGRVGAAVRGVRGQRGVPALRRQDVRGVQGLLQADGTEKCQVSEARFYQYNLPDITDTEYSETFLI